jgi:proteasome lid subunit RPN8/RPN11
MSSPLEFRITQRHYDIIIKQALTNYPQESGGFLGGKDFVIQGILPTFNQYLFNKTDTFGVNSEDFLRAHEFFKKHGMSNYGVYHTHPNAVAYPSKQDIATGQKYHFIVGLRDPKKPEFLAYEIINKKPVSIPLIIVEDKHFSVVDIHHHNAEATPRPLPNLIKRDPASEAAMLHQMMENIKQDKKKYQKLNPLNTGSDFSTLA